MTIIWLEYVNWRITGSAYISVFAWNPQAALNDVHVVVAHDTDG